MHKALYATLLIIASLCFFTLTASAFEERNPAGKRELIYGSTVDMEIAFYQKRLYLADSEYKILSDIALDAARKIAFLRDNREKLVDKMILKNVRLTTKKVRGFVSRQSELHILAAYPEPSR